MLEQLHLAAAEAIVIGKGDSQDGRKGIFGGFGHIGRNLETLSALYARPQTLYIATPFDLGSKSRFRDAKCGFWPFARCAAS
jgi:hypothetical protein